MIFVKAVGNIYGLVNVNYLAANKITILLNIYEKVMNTKDYRMKKRINFNFYDKEKRAETSLPDK